MLAQEQDVARSWLSGQWRFMMGFVGGSHCTVEPINETHTAFRTAKSTR